MALKLGTIFGGSTTAIAGTAGAVSVMMAAAVGVMMMRGDDAAEAPVEPSVPQVEEQVEETTPDAVAAEASAEVEPDAAPMPDAPVFDLVRVEADGSAVVAGRSSAAALVTLRLDGDAVQDVEADAGGAFVALLSLAPSDSPRVLSLEAVLGDSDPVAGRETVIIAPFGMEGPEPEPDLLAEVDPEPETEVERPGVGALTSAAPSVDVDTDAELGAEEVASLPGTTPGQTPEADVTPAPEPAGDAAEEAPADPADPAPAAPSIMIASDSGVRMLQAGGDAPLAQTDVQIDAISYNTVGDVTLSGRGPATTELRVLLNNEPIRLGEVGPGGDWSLDLPEVDPGTYTLSVEQLSEDGSVTARVDTPFLREDPDRIAASPMLVQDGASVITVQPGFTLWGIAQANLGEGILYVSIFEENRDQIDDPDLIFPGQIFSIPDLPQDASSQ